MRNGPGNSSLCFFQSGPFIRGLISSLVCGFFFRIIINIGPKEPLRGYGAHPLILGRTVPKPSETNDCSLYVLIHPREGGSLDFSKGTLQRLRSSIARGF